MASRREAIESSGTQVAFVHMGSEKEAKVIFARYGLEEAHRVSDPEADLYGLFRLGRAGLGQMLGPRTIARAAGAFLRGHRVGKPVGDVLQMPGTFLVYRGRLLQEFRHRTVADRPDYESLAACPISSSSSSLP